MRLLTDRPPRAVRLARALASCALACALAAGLAACDGYGSIYSPTDPTIGTAAGGTNGAASTSVVGRWRRTLLFDDGTAVRGSETTWVFDGAGNATRTVVASNFTDGIADAITSAGTYTTSGTTLTVRFLTPSASTAAFAYRVDTSLAGGATLFLDGTAFTQQAGR